MSTRNLAAMLLPDVVDFFSGGRAFDVQHEVALTVFIVGICGLLYVFVFFFLDDDLKLKASKRRVKSA